MFFMNTSRLKYEAILAYCHLELRFAEKSFNKGEGKKCAINERKLRRILKYICSKIEHLKCTKNDIKNKSIRFPALKKYYDEVDTVSRKYFKKGDEYIPAMLVLELLSIYKEKGFKDFSKIDFSHYQANFEAYPYKIPKLIPKHFEASMQIANRLDSMDQSKKKIKKNSKKEQIAG